MEFGVTPAKGRAGGGGASPAGASTSVLRRFAANSAGPICSFVAGPVIARALGVQGRGLVAAVTAPIALAMSVLIVATGEVLAAEMAAHRESRNEAFWPGTMLSVALGSGLAAAVWVAAPALVGGDPSAMRLLRLSAFLLIPAGVQVSLRALRQAERRYSLTNREAWVGSVFRLACLLVLEAIGRLTISSTIVVTVVSMFATAVLLGRPPSIGGLASVRRWLPYLRRRLAGSAVLLVGSVAAILTLRVDQLLLTPLAGPRELGLYAVSVTVAELPLVATEAMRQILLTETAARQEAELVARATRLTVLALVIMAAAGVAASPFLLAPLFGSGFSDANSPTQILLIGTVFLVPSALMSTGLLAMGRPLLSVCPTLLGLGLTALIAPLGIVLLGAVGAALASLIAYAGSSALALELFRRHHGLGLKDCLVASQPDLAHVRATLMSNLGSARRRRGDEPG